MFRLQQLVAIFTFFLLAASFTVDIGPSDSSDKSGNSKTTILFPLPKNITTNPSAQPLAVSPCQINYKIIANPATNIQRIINQYLIDVFKCEEIKPANITLIITVKNPENMTSHKATDQKYQLNIRNTTVWDLIADNHVGFLRGFQTFSQIFVEDPDKEHAYIVRERPILISDEPDYVWRGVMLDTSRHYYPVDSILHLIDGLMYNRMSILHWHIVDEDSFPLEIPNRDQLSNYGKLTGTYSKDDLLKIISYGKVRGVRIIPEFDTPAHTQSWGRSEALKDIVVKCNNKYQGEFDPTLNKTYEVVKDVMSYINQIFIDNYVHFGGDQISEGCWDQKPEILEWMKSHNISNYKELEIYYRRKQKDIWRKQMKSEKKAIYWANQKIDLPTQSDDVIQWWGVTQNVKSLENRTNEIVLSNYDVTYLDLGFGGHYGTGYGTYVTWRQVYSFNPKIQNVNVIGGQTCMWSEIGNENTIDQKIWIRSSAFAERLWNVGIDINKDLLNVSQRLISQAKRMKRRGFKVSVVTVGLCQKDPAICFG